MARKRKTIRESDWVKGVSYNNGNKFIGFVISKPVNKWVKVKVTRMFDINTNEELSMENYHPQFTLTIHLDRCELYEDIELTNEQIKEMIDIALDNKDKRMFNKYRKMLLAREEVGV